MLLCGLTSNARKLLHVSRCISAYPDLVTISLCERTTGMGCDHAQGCQHGCRAQVQSYFQLRMQMQHNVHMTTQQMSKMHTGYE